MKIAALVLASVLVFLLIVNATDARERRMLAVIGHLTIEKVGGDDDDDGIEIPVCHCFNPTPPNCLCALGSSARTGAAEAVAYDDLTTLDSFDGEDEEFIYFSVGVRENTEPAVFDLTVRGDARVKVSKQRLREYLLSEE